MNMPPQKSPNQRLRSARLERGWTQQDLADRLGTTVVTVKRWERGYQRPGPYFRRKLVALFAMSEQALGLSHSVLPEERNHLKESERPLDWSFSEDISPQPDQVVNETQHQKVRAPIPPWITRMPDTPSSSKRWRGAPFRPVQMIAISIALLVLLFGGFLWRVSSFWPFFSSHPGNAAHPGVSHTTSLGEGVFPPSTSPNIDDSLTSPQTQGGWHHGGTHCIFTRQGYIITEPSVNYCGADARSFTDMVYEITMTLLQGRWAGVDFRADDQSHLYAFTISRSGDYLLEMVNPTTGQLKVLAEHQSQWIRQGYGQANRLGVVARGSTFEVYANDHLLATVEDRSYRVGWVGVVAGSYQDHHAGKDVLTSARYTDAKIWQSV